VFIGLGLGISTKMGSMETRWKIKRLLSHSFVHWAVVSEIQQNLINLGLENPEL
jgi:hypothetical protein